MSTRTMRSSVSHASSGVVGLDDVLIGGFPRDHLYLIEGDPGTGKTTFSRFSPPRASEPA
ncbi:MAG TPA: ATPase domain-containing protein, partial [Terriglobales bacterium]|nr:ATPase domain-containing protein [Terriglobales bacterium]